MTSSPADTQPAGSSVEAAVEVNGLVKQFDEVRALDGLELTVLSGMTFGLLGPNGAGKSTLMRVLTGPALPTSGGVEVLGLPMPDAARTVRSRTGLVPQADNLDDQLTCAENLTLYARLYGLPRSRRQPAVATAAGGRRGAGVRAARRQGGHARGGALRWHASALAHRPGTAARPRPRPVGRADGGARPADPAGGVDAGRRHPQLAVSVANRVMDEAESGEILVSRTIPDLTVGSAARFERAGSRRLKGLVEKWDVFRVEV